MANKFEKLRAPIRADPERRARVEQFKRAMLDAIKLAELRERRKMTQQDVASSLSVSQTRVSAIERGDNLYLSTLDSYVAALGGRLEIAAVFPEERVNLTPPPTTC